MGLLNYITATSLDEDYAHVSERRRSSGEAKGGNPPKKPGTVGVAVLAAFGVLVYGRVSPVFVVAGAALAGWALGT